MNKLLIIHYKRKKKKFRIALLFSWIAFVSIVFSLNLIKKVIDFFIVTDFPNIENKLVSFKYMGKNCELMGKLLFRSIYF